MRRTLHLMGREPQSKVNFIEEYHFSKIHKCTSNCFRYFEAALLPYGSFGNGKLDSGRIMNVNFNAVKVVTLKVGVTRIITSTEDFTKISKEKRECNLNVRHFGVV